MAAPAPSDQGWWARYAAAHLRRPYERSQALGSSWRGSLAPVRLASGVAFELAYRCDAKGAAFLDRYPLPSRVFDRVGLWLSRRGL